MYRRFFSISLLLAMCGAAHAQAPVGELFASGASVKGEVRLAGGGTIVLSGSSVSAGSTTAVLRLARGGEVRICPATALTATGGKRTELTFGLGTGALELRYDLDSHSDTVVTPDFRLLLAGPGNFRVAVGTRSNGDTCMKSLEGNAASVIVNEQMGDGTFQLQPGDAVLFRGGNINDVLREPGLACGCPAPPAVMMAESGAPKIQEKTPAPAVALALSEAPASEPTKPVQAPPAAPISATTAPAADAPAPATRRNVVIDVPMAFSGGDAPVPPAPAPAAHLAVARLDAAATNFWFPPTVLPPGNAASAIPAAQPKAAKHGFFSRLFGALFGRHKSS